MEYQEGLEETDPSENSVIVAEETNNEAENVENSLEDSQNEFVETVDDPLQNDGKQEESKESEPSDVTQEQSDPIDQTPPKRDPMTSLSKDKLEDNPNGEIIQKVMEGISEGIPAKKQDSIQKFVALLLDKELSLVSAMFSATQATEIDKTSAALVTLFEYAGATEQLLIRGIEHEVDINVEPTTLFRGNNITPRILYHYAKRVGEVYQYQTLKPTIEEICNGSVSFEIDPVKVPESEDATANAKNLINGVESFLSAISKSVDSCPWELKVVL